MGSFLGSFSGSGTGVGSEKCRKYFVSCKPLFTYTWFSKDLLRFSAIRAIDLLGRPKVWGAIFRNRWLLKCCFCDLSRDSEIVVLVGCVFRR